MIKLFLSENKNDKQSTYISHPNPNTHENKQTLQITRN